jgi:undecaprenyl diphosphate synthase
MVKHLALIMDGNRRWAKARGLPSIMGHKQGVDTAETIAKFCLEKQIPYLTLYVFSLENFKRSLDEKNYLFNLIQHEFVNRSDFFNHDDIRVNFVGDRSLFPQHVMEAVQHVEEKTQHNNRLHLQLLFCYGGQQEIIAAAQSLAEDVLSGQLSVQGITHQIFTSRLWSSVAPAPDLIIRTGGVQRLSNFLLYNSAYSELFFSSAMWPDFSLSELESILFEYSQRMRNFGV